jgi:hypothetical protein
VKWDEGPKKAEEWEASLLMDWSMDVDFDFKTFPC